MTSTVPTTLIWGGLDLAVPFTTFALKGQNIDLKWVGTAVPASSRVLFLPGWCGWNSASLMIQHQHCRQISASTCSTVIVSENIFCIPFRKEIKSTSISGIITGNNPQS